MPDDRFLHPRVGQSHKIAQLSYRASWVWATYLLAADDFGVMPFDSYSVQRMDRRLRKEAPTEIAADLQMLVTVGLVLLFTDQDSPYICDPLWQDFQHLRFPKVKTVLPCPPLAVIEHCCRCTAELFQRFHRQFSVKIPKSYKLTHSLHAGCLQAKGLRLTANGLRQEAKGLRLQANGCTTGFEKFWAEYPNKVGKDAARREFDKLAPDNDLTDRMIAAVRAQRASAQWRKDGGQFIPHPRTWLHQGRWQDELPPASPGVSARTTMLGTATKAFLASDS